MTKPEFSIIMPTYNQAWFLPRALRSISEQTCRDFELIVVDDGSTDGTEPRLHDTTRLPAAFQSDGPPYWLTAYRHGDPAAPLGTHAAINSGVRFLDGRWLTWVSSDNLMHSGWLARMRTAIGDRQDIGAVYCGFTWLPVARWQAEESTDEQLWRMPAGRVLNNVNFCQLDLEACQYGPAFCIRADVWRAAGEHRSGAAHDLDHWLRVEEACAAKGLEIINVPASYCLYLAHEERRTVTERHNYDAPAVLLAARARRYGEGVA